MRFFCAVFAFFAYYVTFAQYPASPNLFDENGKRTGHWTILYDSNFYEVHDPDSVVYYRLIRFEAGVPAGKIRDFSKTSFKYWDGYAKSIDPYVFDGESNHYHENGKLSYRQTYVDGKREGPCQEFYPNGNKKSVGQFHNDLQEGVWQYFFEDGSLQIDLTYELGKKTGAVKFYHNNGKVRADGSYKDGLFHGLYYEFYEDGTKSLMAHYRYDTLHGIREEYYKTGAIESRGNYTNAQRDGAWTFYHQNGNVKSKGLYKNGEQTGFWEFFHENGKISNSGNVVNGELEGEWNLWYDQGGRYKTVHYRRDTLYGHYVEYNQNGSKYMEGETEKGFYVGPWRTWTSENVLIHEGSYVAGRKEGIWKDYYSSGEPETIAMYREGQQEGKSTKYYRSGQVLEVAYYKNGLLDSAYISYHENGKVNGTGVFKEAMKQGEWKWNFTNGQLYTVNHYIDDKENGWLINYFENGAIRAEAERRNNIMYGSAKFYFRNGSLHQVGSYIDGLFDGKWLTYDSASGKLVEQGIFTKGKRNGVFTTYDPKGKVTSKNYYIHGWQETVDNIRDSIEHLIRIRDYDNAFKAVKWMQIIEKRDYKNPGDRLLSMSMLARVHSAMREYQKAYDADLKYLKGVEKYWGKSVADYKTALHNVATDMHSMKKYDEALRYYDNAIEIAKPQGLVRSYWSTIINKAYCLFDAGRPADASAMLDDEIIKAETLYGPDSSAAWYLRFETADYYYDRPNDYAKSSKMFEELIADIDAANGRNRDYWYNANQRLGRIYYYQFDRNADAAIAYGNAAAYAEKNGLTDTPVYGDILTDMFYIYNTRNALDTVGARQDRLIFEKLEKFVVECPYALSKAEGYLAMGNEIYNEANYPEAFKLFQKAGENFIAAGYGNGTRYAAVLQSLAFSLYYSDRLRYAEAEQYFLKSIEIKENNLERTAYSYYNSLLQLSKFYSMIEKYDVSADIARKVQKIAMEVNDQIMIAKCNQQLGETNYNRWHYTDAIADLKEAVTFYETRGTEFPDAYITSIGYIASSYKYRDEYEEAIKWAKRGITVSESLFGQKSAYYLNRVAALASVYDRNERYTEALKYYNQAATGFANLDGAESISAINQQISSIETRYRMHDYKKAIEIGEQLLTTIKKTYTEKSDPYLTLVAIVAQSHEQSNAHAPAEEKFVAAVNISRSINGVRAPTTAMQLSRLGRFYDRRNRLEEAKVTLEEAVGIMKESDYRTAIAIVPYLGYLGNVLQELDKNKEAEDLYNEAFSIARQDSVNNLSTYVEAGQELSRFYSKVGRFKEAETLIRRLTTLIEQAEGKGYYYAQTRQDLAYMYYRLGRYEEAEKEATELLTILEETVGLDHWLVLRLHNYLGIIYDDQSEFEKARKEFIFCIDASKRKKVLSEIDQASLATFHSNVGRIELCLGNYESAGKHLDECDRIRKQYKVVEGQANSAATLSNRASYYQAVKAMDKAEATWATLNKSLLDFSKANFYFMTDEEKAQFWKSYNGYFHIFQAFAAQRAKQNPAIVADMYNVQLATKAILLSASNKIRKRILSSRDTSMVSMYYQWTRKREQLAQLYSSPANDPIQRRKIDSLEIAAKLLEKEMNISAEDVSNDRGGETVTWKNVQALLAPDEAAVEIIRFKHYDRYWRDSVIYAAMVVTSETRQYPKFVVLNDGKHLEGRYLKYYRNSIAAKIVDTVSYHQYWKPLDETLKGKSRVYLSLDGVYNQINLNTLMNSKGEFLVDYKNLTILSNTKDLLAIKSRKMRRMSLSSATLFGFPTYFLGGGSDVKANATTRDFDRTGISPLAGTQEEIKKVGSILQAHKMKAEVYTNESASEHAIKQLQHPRVLHIATHGFFVEEDNNALAIATGNETNPLLRAGLLLAGAANFIQDRSRVEDENGILTAYEAANLDLDNTDLVVLSACETGKGEVQNGEGVYGLQRAFQTAGAQTIVMSLWKVDDSATQQLMTSFYSNWMDGMSKAEALKTAQISLKKQFPHPYYWGAFVMLEN